MTFRPNIEFPHGVVELAGGASGAGTITGTLTVIQQPDKSAGQGTVAAPTRLTRREEDYLAADGLEFSLIEVFDERGHLISFDLWHADGPPN